MSDEEKKLVDSYAKMHSMSLSEAFKTALFEKIEDEYDLKVYNDAHAEYVENGCKYYTRIFHSIFYTAFLHFLYILCYTVPKILKGAIMPKNYKGYQVILRGKSYQLRINYKGQTYFYTYHPPEGLTPSKQRAAAEKEAARLRDLIHSGYAATVPTFREYANYVLEAKKSLALKKSTQNGYKYILRRINDEFGDHTLDQITPARLNQFYVKLKKDTKNIDSAAKAKGENLRNYLREQSITIKRLSEIASIAPNTTSLAVNGKRVSLHTTEAICSALSLNLNNYFSIINKQTTPSTETVTAHIRLINAIMNQAVREKLIETNPVEATIKPKKKNQDQTTISLEKSAKSGNVLVMSR